jgi:hypothetical protein
MHMWLFFIIIAVLIAGLGFFAIPSPTLKFRLGYVAFMAIWITALAVPMSGVLRP